MFCALAFSNGMQWVVIAPIAKSFKENYHISTFEADLVSLIYMIFYPFVTPLSSYRIDNVNMRLGVKNIKSIIRLSKIIRLLLVHF